MASLQADEALLDDPRLQEAFPKKPPWLPPKWLSAMPFPASTQCTLAQQEAVVADLRAVPVETEAQQYITEAAEARVAKNRKAWRKTLSPPLRRRCRTSPCDACEPRSERLRDVDGARGANTPRCSWRRATSTSGLSHRCRGEEPEGSDGEGNSA